MGWFKGEVLKTKILKRIMGENAESFALALNKRIMRKRWAAGRGLFQNHMLGGVKIAASAAASSC